MNQVKQMSLKVSLVQTFLKQRRSESVESGEPNESDDLKGSFSANVFETKME